MENYLFYNIITIKIYNSDYTVHYGFYHINVISSYLSILYIDYENEKKKNIILEPTAFE
jgi:hypothetical protein